MSEPTPGPWGFDRVSGSVIAGDREVARFHVFPSLADRNLIAAAPLLLEAAEAALKLFDEYAIEEEHPQKIAALRTAINAAKGNQQ